jgi:predicted esterase
VLQAISDLSAYIDSEGPFDGVMGFSQGAALAAMLLARHSSSSPPSTMSFSFAIFLCAGAPFCERSLHRGDLALLDPTKGGEVVIKVPTAHIVGRKDDALDASMRLVDLCLDSMKRVYDHGAGHEVPVNPKAVTKNMVSVIEDVIAKATFTQ